MSADIYKNLHEYGIFEYGSNELLRHEKNITKYFEREYARWASNSNNFVNVGYGDIALAAQDLASSHYDESLSLFESFLDIETMTYSMAYFGDDPGEAFCSNKSLWKAQIDKLELVSNRIGLKGDEILLNIGCGFGSFESYLLDKFPEIKITSITHSKTQYDYIVSKKNDLNSILSSDRLDIHIGQIGADRALVFEEKSYDVICSIGVLEHINNIELLYNMLHDSLVDNGRMFHHLITSRDLIPQLLDCQKTLIKKYFPGGRILPFHTLNRNFSGFNLKDSWFINGMNYWKTIDRWHFNFWKNIGQIYPDKINIEQVRHWNEYFVLCKAMFFPESGMAYGNGQYLYEKRSS